MDKQIERVGCFRIGHKVFRGKGQKLMTITGFRIGSGLNKGQTYAELNGRTAYDIREITLAGPNGDGVGA